MRSVSEGIVITAPPERVFAYVDDIRNMGWHMSEKSSMPMMGSRLRLEIVSPQRTGIGATYRYSGNVLGFSIDFSETVTRYIAGREKTWHTVGEPRLLIMSGYEMRLAVEPLPPGSSRLAISIDYELPRSWAWRFLGMLLADVYARWCLKQMCQGAKAALESPLAGSTPARASA